ncbi:MAG: PDZ domain-containing protein [Acetobacteraceae bacterium]|nr:PDZ domain-containing protein [Acetobacteraceae bacterium]
MAAWPRRPDWGRWTRCWGTAMAVAAALFVLSQVPTGLLVIAPGAAADASGLVSVEGGRKDSAGSFLVTTVSAREAGLLAVLVAALHPRVSLRHKSQFLPPGMEWEDYLKETGAMMAESQAVAQVVGLSAAGREARLDGEGAEVVALLAGSPCAGKLQPGDVVVSLDGEGVALADDLLSLVRERLPGDKVRLGVERGRERLEVEVELGRWAGEPGTGALLLSVRTHRPRAETPVKVEFSAGDISGPSAGLIFALAIIDQLDPRDLTGGRVVAGTGTLDVRGRVGPVGGVREKALAARAAGARVFLVPAANQAEARSVRGLAVVPVATLQDALAYLGRNP